MASDQRANIQISSNSHIKLAINAINFVDFRIMSKNSIREEKIISAFGKHLKELRLKKGMSQYQLAYTSDISRNSIMLIEKGEINTSISVVYRLAKALDIELEELFTF